MSPEAGAFLAKARQFLDKAADMLRVGWPDEASRAAYLAGFHAAQALIFEAQGTAAKTHRGVQAGFARLAQEKALLDPGLRRFLSRAYAYKTIADYETGAAAPISGAMAEAAVAEARRFVAAVEALVAAGGGGEAAPPPG